MNFKFTWSIGQCLQILRRCLFVCFPKINQVGKDKLLFPSLILKDGYFSQSSLSSGYSLLKFTAFCGAPNDNSPPCVGTDSQSWSYNYRIKWKTYFFNIVLSSFFTSAMKSKLDILYLAVLIPYAISSLYYLVKNNLEADTSLGT